MASIGQTWRGLRDRFAATGSPSAALDARLLVRHVLGLDDTQLIAREADPFPQHNEQELAELAVRRIEGVPIARLVGTQEFYGLSFALNSETLVPRPETEMLVDWAVPFLRERAAPRLLDLGTGTGCIAISILDQVQRAKAIGVDIAAGAVAQARANAQSLGVADRFAALEGSWFAPVVGERFDLIVSNPPYIAREVIATLAIDVKHHDPMAALDGGADGLDPYRLIAMQARRHLHGGAAVVLEIGYDQGHIVCELMRTAGFDRVDLHRELAGLDRMVTARFR